MALSAISNAREKLRDMTLELVHEELERILNCSLQEITSRFAGIHLCKQETCLSDDVCTIHTILEASHRTVLLLYADVSLLVRLAQNIMHREEVSERDIQDVATEYFNVVCGRIAAGIYQTSHVASRFQPPSFFAGRYLPDGDVCCQCMVSFRGEHDESVRLVCMRTQIPNSCSLPSERV